MKRVLIGIIVLVVIVIIGIFFIGRAPEDIERADINSAVTTKEGESEEEMTQEDILITNGILAQKVKNYDPANLNFKFTGYGPGKSHEGTFNTISITNILHDNDTITKGTVSLFAETVNTGIGDLDKHLCVENFLDCVNHPQIRFTVSKVSRVNDVELKVTDDLEFKDTTKEISFTLKQEGDKFSADFVLDVAQFGFVAPNIVDNEVRIQFDSVL